MTDKSVGKYRYYEKTERLWTKAGLDAAVRERLNGAPLNETARKYHMSPYTLCKAVKEAEKAPEDRIEKKGFSGRDRVLSTQMEQDIAALIRAMARAGFGVRKKDIPSIILEFCTGAGVGFTKEPTKVFAAQFMARNLLTLRKERLFSVSRLEGTSNPFVAYDFYRLLRECISELKESVSEDDLPNRIWNMDETGFPEDPGPRRTVGGSGERTITKRSAEGKKQTTVVGCVSASGRALPPMVIFKLTNRPSEDILADCMPGMSFEVSDHGWMTKDLFPTWFDVFCDSVKERPLILLMDGLSSHIALKVLEKAFREKIILLKLPPHTTDVLQPLDVVCFATLKAAWLEKLRAFQDQTSHRFNRKEFCTFLSELWDDHFSRENIQSAFRKCGVHPLDPGRYPKDRLDPRLMKKYEEWTKAGSPEMTDEVYNQFITALSPKKAPPQHGSDEETDPEEPGTSTAPPKKRNLASVLTSPTSVAMPPKPTSEPVPGYPSPGPGFVPAWVLNWTPCWVPGSDIRSPPVRPGPALTPEDKTQHAFDKVMQYRFGPTPPAKKRKFAEVTTTPEFIQTQREKEEKREAQKAKKAANAAKKAEKALLPKPISKPKRSAGARARDKSESEEEQWQDMSDSEDDIETRGSPQRLRYPPKSEWFAKSHMKAIWDLMAPPAAESGLQNGFYGLVYYKTGGGKPILLIGKLLRRFLYDAEDDFCRVVDKFEFRCLEPTVYPGNHLREPKVIDDDFFPIYDIIDGPLALEYDKDGMYYFGGYDDLKTVFQYCKDIDRRSVAVEMGVAVPPLDGASASAAGFQ